MDRMEEFIYNKEWPWFYCKNLFKEKGQRHIPQKIIKRNVMENPRSNREELKDVKNKNS